MKWPFVIVSVIQCLIASAMVIGTVLPGIQAEGDAGVSMTTRFEASDWITLALAASLILSALGIVLHTLWGRVLGILSASAFAILCAAAVYNALGGHYTGPHAPRLILTALQAFLSSQLFAIFILLFAWNRPSIADISDKTSAIRNTSQG